MKVLLIGADGMLGTALVTAFNQEELVSWTIDDLDITQKAEVLKKVSAEKPDLILNATGYTNVDGAEDDTENAFVVNEKGVQHLAEAAKKVKATLVHYSTDYVFSGTEEDGYAEDAPAGPPINVYGASKLAGEEALRKVKPTYYLIRTAWLYGENGKNFVDTMLRLAGEHDTLSVIDDQYGSPTYTKDLAEATYTIVTDKKYKPGVYHLVNDGEATWRTFAEQIFAEAKLDTIVKAIPTEEYPLPAKRPSHSRLKNTKGPKLRSWRKGLADYLASRHTT